MLIQPHCSYFLFINSGSGGGVGQKLIQQEKKKAQKISFQLSLQQLNPTNKKKIDVYFYNLRTSRQKGFNVLKLLTQKGFNTKVVICGGDGTVMWVVSELHNYNIDTELTPLAIIPLGTGNDFSQYLGWGKMKSTLTENSFSSLKKLIKKWEQSKIQYFDIWDVKAEVFQYGKFQKVQNQKNKLIQGKVFEKSFCNYFSFGLDGKIGYSFDMHRTKSRIGNLAMYGMLGMLKSMTKTKSLNTLVHGMEIREDLDYDFMGKQVPFQQPLDSMAMNKQYTGLQISSVKKLQNFQSSEHRQRSHASFIFKTKNSKKQTPAKELKKDYQNIVALNINSFMGGVFDIWKNAKFGFQDDSKSQMFTQMSSNDGKLQFISFPSSVGMAAQRTLGGFAQKIAQGEGPFYFQFKQYPENEKHRTYLQVDGQFIRFTHPKFVIIRKSLYGKNGKVKILRNIGE